MVAVLTLVCCSLLAGLCFDRLISPARRLRRRVFATLDNSVTCGSYELGAGLYEKSSDEIAFDMCTRVVFGYGDAKPCDLVPYVREWQRKRLGTDPFRPGRSAHQALQSLHTAIVSQGLRWVVDIDIYICQCLKRVRVRTVNMQEFAALKAGDKIDNPMNGSAGEVVETTVRPCVTSQRKLV
jgi:hypothetical protein